MPRPSSQLRRQSQRRKGRMALRGRPALVPVDSVSEFMRLPDEPFCGSLAGNKEAVDWALLWLPEGGDSVGKLCQPDPHRPGRHARQWAAPGAAGCDARVLRVSQPAAAWRQAGARGCLGAHHLRLVHEDAGATVLWPDQGAPVIPRGGGVRFRRGQGCVQPVAQCPPRAGHAIGGAGHQQRWASSEGEQEGRTQAHHPRPGTAWQAGRLRRPGPDACRAVPGRR